ncbi:MAG: phytanoyl-CoA dioxygenase family protein [Armatimonadetes bacterium]|nr:phytanoyl-CoA dioxygenase family protein [Armatimonadota bacterium]MDE2205648.1 phytanoyl-CoA dioxygenase family protein [Armatimonadota bacterium]
MNTDTALKYRRQLTDDGFCVIENVVPESLLEELRVETDRLLDSVEHPEHWKYQGSDLHVRGSENDVIDRLDKLPAARQALDAMGLVDFKSRGGFIILSKPPGGPALYWHQDWTQWNDPISAAPWPQYLFLSYYLVDTSVENGCFQAIPGTHRQRIPLHDKLAVAHTDASYFAPESEQHLFGEPDGAVDVPVKAGSLVIGEGRMLHAARANQSLNRRTLLLGWYDRPATIPDYWTGSVPEEILSRRPDTTWPSTREPGVYLKPHG